MGSQAKYRAGIEIRMLGNLGPMFDKLTSKVKKFTNGLRPASRNLDKTFGQKRIASLKKFSRGMDFAVQKTRMLKFAAVGAFAMATKVSADFEEQMFRLGFNLNKLNTKEFADLKNNMRELAGSTIFTPTQIATAAKELGKAGRSIAEINEQMPDFARFAQIAEGDVVEMSRDFSAAFTAIAKKGETPLQFMETMAAAMMKTRLTGQSLTEVFKFAGSELQNFEGPTKQIAILAGTLADSMQDGSRAGTGLRAMFKRLANPTGESVKVLRKWVETVKTVDSSINAQDIFSKKGFIKDFRLLFRFVSKANVNAKELDEVFGKIAGTSLSSALGKDGIAGLNTSFDKTEAKIDSLMVKFAANGGILKQFDKQFKKTAKGSMFEFLSVLQDIGIQVGDSGLLGAVTDLLRGLIELLKGFKNLSPFMKKSIVLFAALGTAFLWLMPLMSSLLMMMTLFPPLGIAISVAFLPLIIALAQIVLFSTALIMFMRNIDAIVQVTGEFIDLWQTWFKLPFKMGFALLNGDIDEFIRLLDEAIDKFVEFTRLGETQAEKSLKAVANMEAKFNAEDFRVTAAEAKMGVTSRQAGKDGNVFVWIKNEDGSQTRHEVTVNGDIKLGENTGQQ